MTLGSRAIKRLNKLYHNVLCHMRSLQARLANPLAGKQYYFGVEQLEERVMLSATDLQAEALTTTAVDNALVVNYEVKDAEAGAFDVGIYSSTDGQVADDLLQTIRVDDAALLTVGSHELAFNPDFVDSQGDYSLMAMLDINDEVAESDELNNQGVLGEGLFLTADGTVHVHGSDAVDEVNITQPGKLKVEFNDVMHEFAAADITGVHLRLHGGDDDSGSGTGVQRSIWAYGGEGADVLYGGNTVDILAGGVGDDEIHGRQGDDTLLGEAGNDTLEGDLGEDLLEGGAGNDELDGNQDDDVLRGGDGDDIITGGFGEDELIGGAGDDYLEGNQHADLMEGGAGNDTLVGGFGA
ncbi:MAG TPA: hypothetical protein ENL03_04105, partial [Phycisphaerae bacterium]|nr:hypothetical protein [Phycisphaerae bacterium]